MALRPCYGRCQLATRERTFYYSKACIRADKRNKDRLFMNISITPTLQDATQRLIKLGNQSNAATIFFHPRATLIQNKQCVIIFIFKGPPHGPKTKNDKK